MEKKSQTYYKRDTGAPVKTLIERTVDDSGKIVKEQKSETRIVRTGEPDYIKIYTRMWLEFNQIDTSLAPLFLELASRMSYADSKNPESSQVVYTCEPAKSAICKALNIKQRQYQRGLAALCDCGAIRRISRGAYQINPAYAGRGSWYYDERLQRGGVANLIATFDFAAQHNETEITWTDEAAGAIVLTTDDIDADFGVFEEDAELEHIMQPEEGENENDGNTEKNTGTSGKTA